VGNNNNNVGNINMNSNEVNMMNGLKMSNKVINKNNIDDELWYMCNDCEELVRNKTMIIHKNHNLI